ncbi:MAG TPA: serine hydrolase domain-containing protein [Vicinamibacteria bacterium]|nr:serine hydrolase domain-containing protein [Vicinamibacteria bacterium]
MSSRARARIALALLLALAASSVFAQGLPRAARPEEVGLLSERLQRLTDTFQGYVKDGRLAGAVVLVARRGKIVYSGAFGQRDIETHAPMKEDAIFRIASQTKALVSVAALQLQEEGKLLIADPVGKYIPEFQKTKVAVLRPGGYDIVDAKRPITIRDLLTHTSGVSYGDGPAKELWQKAGITGWYFADRDEPVAATVTRMAALPFDAQPGEKYIYGYNTDILGVVVERASGRSLDEYLRTRIFEPLKMRDTHFYLPPAKADRFATVYSAGSDGKLERAPTPGTMVSQGAYVEGPRKSFSGGAGVLSTAGDYARFLQMMLSGGELEGARILGRKTVELMTVDHIGALETEAGRGFGLGFSVVKDVGLRGIPGSVGEYGWGGAYHSVYWVDPQEQLVVVYFAQLIPSGGLDDHAKLRALVYQAIVDAPSPARAGPPARPIPGPAVMQH